MGAFEIFAIVASAVALVFLSWAIFRMTKFPPGAIFILLGVVLSLFGSRMPQTLVDTVILVAPILLGSILFTCGLKFNLHGVAAHPRTLLLSFITLITTFSVVWVFATFVLGFGFEGSVLAGAIGSGVCSFFVFHILDAVNLDNAVTDSLMLESSLTEAITVMVALAVFEMSSGASAIQAFSFGLVFGLLMGIVWVKLLKFIQDFPHRDALTLSLVLAVAAFCEMIFQNSGMTSAFFFGLAMGNAGLLKSKARFEGLLRFQEDVLMAGGTFLFFYIGLLAAGADMSLALMGAAAWVLVLLLRTLSIKLSLEDRGFDIWLAGLGPKGLSAILILHLAIFNKLAVAGKLFAIVIPILVLSGIFAGISASMLEGRKPPRVETVAMSRGWNAESKSGEQIKHAYDIDEMKRTIDGKESG